MESDHFSSFFVSGSDNKYYPLPRRNLWHFTLCGTHNLMTQGWLQVHGSKKHPTSQQLTAHFKIEGGKVQIEFLYSNMISVGLRVATFRPVNSYVASSHKKVLRCGVSWILSVSTLLIRPSLRHVSRAFQVMLPPFHELQLHLLHCSGFFFYLFVSQGRNYCYITTVLA